MRYIGKWLICMTFSSVDFLKRELLESRPVFADAAGSTRFKEFPHPSIVSFRHPSLDGLSAFNKSTVAPTSPSFGNGA
jgi:hypothetical protein